MKVKSQYINENAAFKITNAENLSYTYFPLCNYYGMKASITPSFAGDLKLDQNHFALLPTSVEDLMNNGLGRNIFFTINDKDVYSASGRTPLQQLVKDEITIEGGFLYHKIYRENQNCKITITSFIPSINENIELHQIEYINNTNEAQKLRVNLFVPLYSRSATNLRDHRHVTALLNKSVIVENGIINRPTLSFDERGHLVNKTSYSVFVDSKDVKVNQYYPILEKFVGEGHTPDYPLGAVQKLDSPYKVNDITEGYEALGGFGFDEKIVKSHEKITLVFAIVIANSIEEAIKVQKQYVKVTQFDPLFQQNNDFWEKELSTLKFNLYSEDFNKWLKWVTLQPILRRIYGNSFLPFHDYGKGGRGWRDLWQDCLSLLLLNPFSVKDLLFSSFGGVRIDGSNATIIGSKDGEFIADRNNIVRVWMDHGVWPLLTLKLYLDNSGDYDFLLKNQSYFKDQFAFYTKEIDKDYQKETNKLLDFRNKVYQGNIFEHLLIQNLVPFYNVGEHNLIRLEDADWNDGLDMAKDKGESVAFSAFYAYNLELLANILKKLETKRIKTIPILKEITILFDMVDFNDIKAKNTLLNRYFSKVKSKVSGEKIEINLNELITALEIRANSLKSTIRESEWLQTNDLGWFNGYYDNDGERVDDIKERKMTLTGQVFNIYGKIASDEQIKKIIKSADELLYDQECLGYRLNTPLGENKMNLGRMMGFAYGHKENGALFSHMEVMYANALYKRGFAREGRKVINGIYTYLSQIEKAKVYPGIVEYIDRQGRGVYPYLTGSASWVILTLVEEVFGVKGDCGDLLLNPKLTIEDFIDSKASISKYINDKVCTITYHNMLNLDYKEYQINEIKIDKRNLNFTLTSEGAVIKKEDIEGNIDVFLGK